VRLDRPPLPIQSPIFLSRSPSDRISLFPPLSHCGAVPRARRLGESPYRASSGSRRAGSRRGASGSTACGPRGLFRRGTAVPSLPSLPAPAFPSTSLLHLHLEGDPPWKDCWSYAFHLDRSILSCSIRCCPSSCPFACPSRSHGLSLYLTPC
jgi:hypothetical protein